MLLETIHDCSITSSDLVRFLRTSASLQQTVRGIMYRRFLSQLATSVEPPKDALQKLADQFRAREQIHTAQATRAWLVRHAMSEDDFESMLEFELLEQLACEAIPESRLEERFSACKARFDSAELCHIEVDSAGLAEELRLRVSEGEQDFAVVAREFSQDPTTRDNGGYLGFVRRLDMPEQLADAVFAAAPGGLLGPIEFDKRFHVVLVKKIKSAALTDTNRRLLAQELLAIEFETALQSTQLDLQFSNLV